MLELRIDLLGYIRSFAKNPREIWNRGERLDKIIKVIVEHTLQQNYSGQNSGLASYFDVIENLKLNYMKQKKELKLVLLDKNSMSAGIVFSTDKKAIKEASISLMDSMRLLCRSRNIPEIYGIASNLYEF